MRFCRGQSQVVSDNGYKSHYVAGLRWLRSLVVTVLSVVFTYEEGHMYFTLPWRKYFVTKCLFDKKMPCAVWVTWIIGKCGLNLVNNDLFWKVKVFSLKPFETKGYSFFQFGKDVNFKDYHHFKSDVKMMECLGMTYLTNHPKIWLSFCFHACLEILCYFA